MEQADVYKQLKAALELLCTRDGYLLDLNANERSITHRLGLYLQGEFSDWDVDCEYNRDGHEPKKLALDEAKFTGESSVYPDIIIHRRGCRGPNLLVIEVKTKSNGKRRDLDKLKAYKRELAYAYAVFLRVWTGKNRPDPPEILFVT